MSAPNALHSYLRAQALGDAASRYAAIVLGLAKAISELDDVSPEVSARLDAAVRDAEAQLDALSDSLARALEDLPEGQQAT